MNEKAITDVLRIAYTSAVREAEHSILRHPAESIGTTLQKLAKRAEGQHADVYGSGELIETFEREVADLLGKPAALFLPSGTLAQPLALKIHSEQFGKSVVGLHPTSHLVLHEQDGYQKLWGLSGKMLGQPDKVLEYGDFARLSGDELAAIVLELPMREIGGQLPSWDDLNKQVDWAKERNVAVHFDGARLWQCPNFYQRSLAEISALADSVYVSFYKDIGGIAGAILAGEEDFIAAARVWNRRAGGNLISMYPYVLAAQHGLAENLESVTEAARYAKQLAPLFAMIEGVTVNPTTPQAAMFHLHIARDQNELIEAVTQYAEQHGIVVLSLPRVYDKGISICEISLGRSALQHSPEFWAQHLQACLSANN
ncbi:threonine aldolase [Pseudidiomarina aestuarii]|uniref:Threonine aldolase n=1 Tax=Pseudidiomarina aestuarii TaxID=624146 RepID=A0A7Z6ZVH2_9GAMM|nr:beta-eliminating lyase-related protein [Pseudidiomarina aestuarii]RUO42032.1 threonine aldolase [Pseudidiomarina aestuarii]